MSIGAALASEPSAGKARTARLKSFYGYYVISVAEKVWSALRVVTLMKSLQFDKWPFGGQGRFFSSIVIFSKVR